MIPLELFKSPWEAYQWAKRTKRKVADLIKSGPATKAA
jgi:hypothetical protein